MTLELRVGKYEFCYFCTVECCTDSGNFLLFYSSFIKMTLCIWSLMKLPVGSPYSWFKDYWTVVASTSMWEWFLFLEKSVDDLTNSNKRKMLTNVLKTLVKNLVKKIFMWKKIYIFWRFFIFKKNDIKIFLK